MYFKESLEEELEPWAYYQLAKVYILKGEKYKAITFLNKAIELAPLLLKKASREKAFEKIKEYITVSVKMDEKEDEEKEEQEEEEKEETVMEIQEKVKYIFNREKLRREKEKEEKIMAEKARLEELLKSEKTLDEKTKLRGNN